MRTFLCMPALAPAYASIAPPAVIYPASFEPPTFQKSFQTLDLTRWRTGPATDPATRSLTATTCFGDTSGGGASPFKPNTYMELARHAQLNVAKPNTLKPDKVIQQNDLQLQLLMQHSIVLTACGTPSGKGKCSASLLCKVSH